MSNHYLSKEVRIAITLLALLLIFLLLRVIYSNNRQRTKIEPLEPVNTYYLKTSQGRVKLEVGYYSIDGEVHTVYISEGRIVDIKVNGLSQGEIRNLLKR